MHCAVFVCARTVLAGNLYFSVECCPLHILAERESLKNGVNSSLLVSNINNSHSMYSLSVCPAVAFITQKKKQDPTTERNGQ